MPDDPIHDAVLDATTRALDRDEDEFGIADEVMRTLGREIPTTVALALVSRVHALSDALRRLADAAYPIADHERGYPEGAVDVVIEGKRLGPDDGVYRVTVQHLRELSEAIAQAEDAIWPDGASDLAPELLEASNGE